MVRMPYELLGDTHVSTAGIRHRIRRVDLADHFGMTSEVLSFLEANGQCFRCGLLVGDLGRHEACLPRLRRFYSGELSDFEVVLPEVHWREFGVLKWKESQRRQSFQRNLRVKRAPGKHTREQLRELLALQEFRCYYCFVSLMGPDGRVNGPEEPISCHKDHYVSLKWGGGHDISNIVLSCVGCNSSKRDMHGDCFVEETLKHVSPSVQRNLKRIHRIRADHAWKLIIEGAAESE